MRFIIITNYLMGVFMLFQRRYFGIVTIFFLLSMSLFLVSCRSLTKSISNSNISERRFYAFPNLDAIEIVSWTPSAELQISVYIDKNVYDAGGKALFSTATSYSRRAKVGFLIYQ